MTYSPTVLKIKDCTYLVFHRFLIHRNLSYLAVNYCLHLFGILNEIKIHKSRVASKAKESDKQNILKIQAKTKLINKRSVNFESKLWSCEFFQKNKRMNSFFLLCEVFSFVFLEEIEDTKKPFKITWPLGSELALCSP